MDGHTRKTSSNNETQFRKNNGKPAVSTVTQAQTLNPKLFSTHRNEKFIM